MSEPLSEAIDALREAVYKLNRASEATKGKPNLLDLHLQIESAWAETDDALSKAKAAATEKSEGES